eukprot:5043330-Amphidinium_carterae.1
MGYQHRFSPPTPAIVLVQFWYIVPSPTIDINFWKFCAGETALLKAMFQFFFESTFDSYTIIILYVPRPQHISMSHRQALPEVVLVTIRRLRCQFCDNVTQKGKPNQVKQHTFRQGGLVAWVAALRTDAQLDSCC